VKKFLLIFALSLVSVYCLGQTTKVRGRVVDTEGEGIPFVGVYFENSTIGITTDLDGYYSLETKDFSLKVLTAQLLGYDTEKAEINPGRFSTVNFTLKLTDNRLSGATVKADNRKAKRLLANIQAHRDKNDPDNHPEFECEIYNKMELDLSHPQELLTSKKFRKDFGFIDEYIDTSVVSGVPYLPVMISETVAKRRHSSNPELNDETIVANRISGINPDMNLLSQFTGSMHLKVNFYKNFINAFNVEFPSPIQASGMLYYNYYIIDSLQVDGRKTYLVRYHPKKLVSTPTFDGEMRIDAEDYAIRSIHANMKNTTNVNWLKDLVIEAEYERQPDSTWFYKSDNYYVDLAMSIRDSSRMLSFIGRRDVTYSNPVFKLEDKISPSHGLVKVDKQANHKDEQYWQEARPAPLSEKEQGVYEMVDRVQDVPIYKDAYYIAYSLINGYFDFKNVGVGPIHKMISFNNLEGFRPQIGFRTTKDFSRIDRYSVYGAYGFKDKKFKGGVTWEHQWSREPQRKMYLHAGYDVHQLGSPINMEVEANFFTSLLGGSNSFKFCMASDYSGNYSHEFSPNVTAAVGFDFRRYFPTPGVEMITPEGVSVHSTAFNEMYMQWRFSWQETVNRGYFTKRYIYSKYPIITVNLVGSIGGIRHDDYSYFRPEILIQWNPHIPPFGSSRITINAGHVMGSVPYSLLHVHEGNNTYIYNKASFSCMNALEFVSDSWATLFWNHCLNGFFLGKIPLIRRLGWREELTLKATWGHLSDKNNGDATELALADIQAPLLFPTGMHRLGNVPYVEVGAGISNILKFIRVDFFWRATHRDSNYVYESNPDVPLEDRVRQRMRTPNFAVNVGAEFRF